MTLSAFLSVIVLLAIGFVALYVLSIYLKYRKSSYYDESGISFLKILFDKGNYGEFLIFTGLEKLERYHRLLTNIYLPKSVNGSPSSDKTRPKHSAIILKSRGARRCPLIYELLLLKSLHSPFENLLLNKKVYYAKL